MQLLLYTTTVTPRLQYICHIIFKEILGVNFLITTSGEEFKNNNGVKIKYLDAPIEEDCFTIGANKLLFETNIIEQDIECFEVNNYKAFYKTLDTDFPFDIFAASFFLISRYEEYLPHTKDIYGRYAHQNSLAFTAHFLQLPLINIWADDLAASLQSKFPGFKTDKKPFRFLPTYDIDMAFSYKHKGWLRNIGGFVRSPSLKRLSVLCDLQKDPYDSFEWLNQLHDQYHLQPLYFFYWRKKTDSTIKIFCHTKRPCSI